MIIRNVYLDRINPFMDTELIKVLVGVRRSGDLLNLSRNGIIHKNIIEFLLDK